MIEMTTGGGENVVESVLGIQDDAAIRRGEWVWGDDRTVATYLGISLPKIRQDRLAKLWQIPFCRAGRRILYNRHKIDEWLLEHAEQFS